MRAAPQQAAPRWERQFPDSVNVLVLHNPSGRSEVEVVAAPTIQVEAEAAAGQTLDPSAITVDESAPGVLVLRALGPTVVHFRIAMPARIVLSVQSVSGEITVRGVAARVLAETQSGNVVLQIPAGLDAEFSFKTATGSVLAGVALAENAGSSGAKGRPVLQARTESGNIVLLPLVGESAGAAVPDSSKAPKIPLIPRRDGPRALRGAQPPAVKLTSRNPAAKKADPSDGRVRVQSDLVLLNAYVVDPAGASIPGLKKEDFGVSDNGKPQDIAIFEPVQRPLDLLILLDLSGSTHSKFDVVKKAVKRFVDVLAPEDRIAIAAFTARFMLISDFTSDRKLLKKRMDDTKNRRGGTEFYKSLWNSLDLLAEVESPRRAIVVMTDGVDNALQNARTSSPVGFDELLQRVRSDGISIYPIYLNTEFQMVVKEGSGDSLAYKEAREQLQAIADSCGTTMFRADRFEDLAGAYERVAAELRNLYTLGFYPSARGEEDWHDLKVTVQRPDTSVRARKGYFVR